MNENRHQIDYMYEMWRILLDNSLHIVLFLLKRNRKPPVSLILDIICFCFVFFSYIVYFVYWIAPLFLLVFVINNRVFPMLLTIVWTQLPILKKKTVVLIKLMTLCKICHSSTAILFKNIISAIPSFFFFVVRTMEFRVYN